MFETNLTISTETGTDAIELRNPASSGKKLTLLRVGVAAETGFALYVFSRYNAIATHEASPAPTQGAVYKWDPAVTATVGEIWSGAEASITWNGSVDYEHTEQLDASDAGDDGEFHPGKYLAADKGIVISQGTSFRMQLPAGQANYVVKMLWSEAAA